MFSEMSNNYKNMSLSQIRQVLLYHVIIHRVMCSIILLVLPAMESSRINKLDLDGKKNHPYKSYEAKKPKSDSQEK